MSVVSGPPTPNPPDPPGMTIMPQKDVTPDMTTWAVAILHDPKTYPLPSYVPALSQPARSFGTKSVRAVVEWHQPDYPIGPNAWHRGVTLFEADTVPTRTRAEGIDVSHYQGTIDWAAVKASGRTFAIVKATEATGIVDPRLAANAAGAKAAGFRTGAYHYFHPDEDPVAQAKFYVATVAPLGIDVHVLDVETLGKAGGLKTTQGVLAWVTYVTTALKRPVVYTSPGFWNGLAGASAVGPRQADLWVASWNVAAPARVGAWPVWTFWQYASTVAVPGATGADVDRFAGTAADLAAYAARPGKVDPTSFNLMMPLGVEEALNYLGATPPLPTDGAMTPLLKSTIEAFQSQHLDSSGAPLAVDGIVGPKTTWALERAMGIV